MISKYVLEKEGRRAVLYGVKHVDQPGMYEELQRDINKAVAEGYVFFYEGIRREPGNKLETKNARRLMSFWSLMVNKGYSYLGEMRGWQTQQENLRPSLEGINADISLEELVRACDKGGVKCSRFMCYVVSVVLEKKLTKVSDYPLPLRIMMAIGGQRYSTWFEKSFWAVINKSRPFIVDYRNEAIFQIVKEQGGRKNVLLLYGNDHIPDLLERFKSDGWTMKQPLEAAAN